MEDKSGFGYFLLGLGLGVAAGLLWAPQSGEETRQYLANRASDGADYLRARTEDSKEYLRQQTETIKGSAADLYDKGRTAVSKQKENLSAAVEAGKQAYRDAVGDVKAGASNVSTAAAGGSHTAETV